MSAFLVGWHHGHSHGCLLHHLYVVQLARLSLTCVHLGWQAAHDVVVNIHGCMVHLCIIALLVFQAVLGRADVLSAPGLTRGDVFLHGAVWHAWV